MKYVEKQKAIELRGEGNSINKISKELKVSKSSVSYWVRDIILSDKQKKILFNNSFNLEAIEKRREKRLINEKTKRDLILNEAKKEIKNISKKELLLVGSMLYLGEGGKTKRMVRISNSDPDVIKIMMRFFREVCGVSEKKFRGHIHTHSHLKVKDSELYWSNISKIPITQFFKTYTKQSISSLNKKDKIPYGTFDIYVNDSKLFLIIMGWIEKIKELIL